MLDRYQNFQVPGSRRLYKCGYVITCQNRGAATRFCGLHSRILCLRGCRGDKRMEENHLLAESTYATFWPILIWLHYGIFDCSV
jgi:hypothetical protein